MRIKRDEKTKWARQASETLNRQETDQLEKDINTFGEKLIKFEISFAPKVESIHEDWVCKTRHFDVYSDSYYDYLSVELPEALPFPIFRDRNNNKKLQINKKHSMFKEYSLLRSREQKLVAKKEDDRRRLYGVILPCGTRKKLLTVFPEIASIVPEVAETDEPKALAIVPADLKDRILKIAV